MLINEYEVTEKMYLSWVFQSKKEGKKLVFLIFWSIMALIAFVLYILSSNSPLFSFMAFYCIFMAVGADFVRGRTFYKQALSMRGTSKWKRSITISSDNIVINDGKIVVNYKTSDITKVVEKGDLIRLFMNDKTSVRMYKSKFVEGNWEDYKGIIIPKEGQ